MLEVDYPGKCFGHRDDKAKECKRCKIRESCKSPKPVSGKTGIEVLRSLAEESGTILLKPSENIRASFVFLHGSIDFLEDGKIAVNKGGTSKIIPYVVSENEAIEIFNSVSLG